MRGIKFVRNFARIIMPGIEYISMSCVPGSHRKLPNHVCCHLSLTCTRHRQSNIISEESHTLDIVQINQRGTALDEISLLLTSIHSLRGYCALVS